MLHGRSGRFLIVVWMVTLRNGRNRTWLLIQGPPGYSWKSLNSCNVPAFKMEFITVRFFIFGSLCFPKTLFDSKTSSSYSSSLHDIKMTRSGPQRIACSNLVKGPFVEADGGQGIQDGALFVGPHLSSGRGELILR